MKPLLHNKYLLGVTIFAIALFMAFHLLFKEAKKQEIEYQENIGKKIVIDKDTLTVVDYNSIIDTYYLSNGTSVNKQFIEQNN